MGGWGGLEEMRRRTLYPLLPLLLLLLLQGVDVVLGSESFAGYSVICLLSFSVHAATVFVSPAILARSSRDLASAPRPSDSASPP